MEEAAARAERRTSTVCEQSDMYPALSMGQKLLYSLTGFSRGIVWAVVQLFFPTFLLEVVQLNWYGVMAVLVAKQIFDGITDPLIGRLSDHTHTHLGRRKPWTLASAVPVLALWLLLWYSPGIMQTESTAWRTTYYGVLILSWSFVYTCMNMPLNALVPDAAPTYDERTSVVVYVETASKVGSCIASFFWTSLVQWYPAPASHEYSYPSELSSDAEYDYVRGYIIAAMFTGPLIVITAVAGAFAVPERPPSLVRKPRLFYSSEEDRGGSAGGYTERVSLISQDSDGTKDDSITPASSILDDDSFLSRMAQRPSFIGALGSFLYDVVDLLTFLPFLVVSVMNLLGLLSVTYFVNNVYLYMKYVIKEESETNFVLLALQVSLISSFVFWGSMAKFLSKRFVFLIGCLPWILTMTALFFVPAHDLWAVYLCVIVRGFSAGVAYLIPSSMLPDVIRLDELRSGKRREGLFYSLFLLMLKVTMAFSQSTSVLALGLAGYQPPSREDGFEYPTEQPDAVLWTLRILVSWIPVAVLILAMISATFYHRIITQAERTLNLYHTGL
eukprot:TRINITY_DN2326_c1_g2_i1.p1 TRINITY_DN2326_c1_g2~~TRINITY_DN2326_c1_g2_i1.p1  ORF type:complete len:557 (-),score=191.89 TRINITY_DN2326_c1_g2_i1:137-1807(-)